MKRLFREEYGYLLSPTSAANCPAKSANAHQFCGRAVRLPGLIYKQWIPPIVNTARLPVLSLPRFLSHSSGIPWFCSVNRNPGRMGTVGITAAKLDKSFATVHGREPATNNKNTPVFLPTNLHLLFMPVCIGFLTSIPDIW